MKKFLLGFILLVVLAGAGLLIYIASIDWNLHKDRIAEQFASVTGKSVVFEGPVSFKILPSPYLTASQVKIYNPELKDQPLVEIKNLVANLELMPLLHKNFEVSRMVLENPVINVDVDDEGRLNWQNDLTPEQRDEIERAQVKLNSVSLEKAQVLFNDPLRDISFQLDDLNGEIIADSMFGPFHIEGNYIKGNNPEGFAISVGKLSDSFSTTLNLVVTHPQSDSYVRFDGNFMLKNKVLNGNMIVESKKLQDFVKANVKSFELQKEYDYPLALTFDLSANEHQVNLSNMVIKYGETQGAGNMQIPLNDGLIKSEDVVRPRVDMAFNFTDLNLDPLVFMVKDFVNTYKKGDVVYNVDSRLDWLVDAKSLRTQYNGQPVKDFETSFDFISDRLSVNSLSAVLPGETDFRLKGDLSSLDGEPFYNFDISFNSDDFLKTLNWMGIHPSVSVASTYRKAVGNARLMGTLQKIQISPFKMTVDKSSFSGEAGIKLGGRPDIMLILNADMINFDNYIAPMPKEERAKSWAQRMQYQFSRLAFLNDFDMQINAKLDLGIYESLPFEKADVQANLLDGKMDIKKLSINSIANAQMEYSGLLTGFGKVPAYKNLNYKLKTADVSALINKFEFKAPNLDYKQLKNFESQGVISGDLDKFAINSQSKLENLEIGYSGQVARIGSGFDYNGNLTVKHPDFVKMVNDFNIHYNPLVFSLGTFDLKTSFKGTAQQFKASDLSANVGFNEFKGDIEYEKKEENSSIIATLAMNKFELERFLNSSKPDGGKTPVLARPADDNIEFLARPDFSRTTFSFDSFKNLDFIGKLTSTEFSYKNNMLSNASADVSLSEGNLNISNISGDFRGGKASGDISLNTLKRVLSGTAKLENSDVSLWNFGGNKYAVSGGTMSFNSTFNTQAGSWEDIVAGMSGNLNFELVNGNIKGWNLRAIYDDIVKREVPEGLMLAVKENLQKGVTDYNSFKGRMSFNNGEYSFSNTAIQNSLGNIEVFGDGSLPAWNMNVVFNVKYNEPQYLPGYSFSLKGPMNAPLLDVNVSTLFDLYQSRQDKIVADQQAREEQERTHLQGMVNEQLNIAKALQQEIQQEVLSVAASRKNEAENSGAKVNFEKLEQQAREEISAISEIINTVAETVPSETLISDLSEENKQSMANVETIRAELEKVYLDELRFRMSNLHNRLVSDYNKAKMLMFDFNTSKEKIKTRLSGIITTFTLEGDKNLNGWQQFISDKFAFLEGDNQKLLDQFNTMKNSESPEAVEAYNQKLRDLGKDVKSDLEAMEDSIKQYKNYAEEQVASEERKYAGVLRNEEIERKIKENTGRISVKKTGRNITVKRDIQEIEESEELTSKEKIPILDFSAGEVKKIQTEQRDSGGVNVIKRRRVK